MREWIRAWAIAGTALWLAGSIPTAAAQSGGGSIVALNSQIEEMNTRIEEADRLLQQVDAGGFLVVDRRRAALVVMSRDQVIDSVTEQIYREGTGIGSDLALDMSRIVPFVRDATLSSRRLAESLRQGRQADLAERDRLQRHLDRLLDAPAAPRSANRCAFPHSWRVRQGADRGVEDISLDADGNLSASGFTDGVGMLSGNQLTIRFVTQGQTGTGPWRMDGRYVVTLDGACNGTGQLIVDHATDDLLRGLSGPATFTSLGGAGPS